MYFFTFLWEGIEAIPSQEEQACLIVSPCLFDIIHWNEQEALREMADSTSGQANQQDIVEGIVMVQIGDTLIIKKNKNFTCPILSK